MDKENLRKAIHAVIAGLQVIAKELESEVSQSAEMAEMPEKDEPKPEPEKAPEITLDDIREAMNARATSPAKRAELGAVVQKFHPMAKVLEIPSEKYPELLAAIESIEVD